MSTTSEEAPYCASGASQHACQPFVPPGPWHIIPPIEKGVDGPQITLYLIFPAGANLDYLENGGCLVAPDAQNHAVRSRSTNKTPTLPFLIGDYVGECLNGPNLDKVLPLLLLQHSGQRRVLRETPSTDGSGSASQHAAPPACPQVPNDTRSCELLRLEIPRALWDEGLRNKTWAPSVVAPLARIGMYETTAEFDLKLIPFKLYSGELKCAWQAQEDAQGMLLARVASQQTADAKKRAHGVKSAMFHAREARRRTSRW